MIKSSYTYTMNVEYAFTEDEFSTYEYVNFFPDELHSCYQCITKLEATVYGDLSDTHNLTNPIGTLPIGYRVITKNCGNDITIMGDNSKKYICHQIVSTGNYVIYRDN